MKIGRWTLALARTRDNKVAVDVEADMFSDRGYIGHNGTMYWDFPERIPKRVKEAAYRMAESAEKPVRRNPSAPQPKYRVSIRPMTYHGVEGFHVIAVPYPKEYEYVVQGRTYTAQHHGGGRVFTVTRKAAERIRDAYKAGLPPREIQAVVSETLLSEPKRHYRP